MVSKPGRANQRIEGSVAVPFTRHGKHQRLVRSTCQEQLLWYNFTMACQISQLLQLQGPQDVASCRRTYQL